MQNSDYFVKISHKGLRNFSTDSSHIYGVYNILTNVQEKNQKNFLKTYAKLFVKSYRILYNLVYIKIFKENVLWKKQPKRRKKPKA